MIETYLLDKFQVCHIVFLGLDDLKEDGLARDFLSVQNLARFGWH